MPGPGRAEEGRPAPRKPAQPAADTGASCPGRGQRQEGPAVQGAVQKCPPPPAVCRLLEPARARPSACPPLCELSSLPLDACLGWYLIITELVTVIITC